jgi:pimeloyl-ACP methyl ester carboxylesterase
MTIPHSHSLPKLFYRITGQGPVVLLVHGFAEDGRVWDDLLPLLPKEFTYIIPDLPGSGRSEQALDIAVSLSIDSLADQLIEGLSQENIFKNSASRPHPHFRIVGHSMGGYIALSLAERFPQWIHSLVLYHSTPRGDAPEKMALRKKSIDFIRKHGSGAFLSEVIPNLYSREYAARYQERIAEKIKEQAGIHPEVWVRYYEAMMTRPDRSLILRKSAMPIGFIAGAKDAVIPFAQSIEDCSLPSQSFSLLLREVGHMGMLENPEKSSIFLTKFLRNTPAV